MSELIFEQMNLVMNDIGAISKDSKNIQQGYSFRRIDAFINALHPALVKHGVFMIPRCVKESHEIKEVVRSNGKPGIDKHVSILMEYDFCATDGSKITIGPVPSEGLDSGDKATNKALSAALKYALIQTFSIPTEDMEEPDRVTPEIGKTLTPTENMDEVDALINDIQIELTDLSKGMTPAEKGTLLLSSTGVRVFKDLRSKTVKELTAILNGLQSMKP